MDRAVLYPPSRRWISGTVNSSTTLTRPNDTTGYTSGDEISDNVVAGSAHPWIFPLVSRNNGGGFTVLRATLISNNSASALTPALWLYTATPTMVGDNVPYSHLAVDDANLVDTFSITSRHVNGVGTDSVSTYSSATLIYGSCAATDTALYGVLIPGAYTPTAQQTFTLRLLVEN